MFFEKPSLGALTFSRGEPESFGAIYRAAYDSAIKVDNLNAQQVVEEDVYDRRIASVAQATGVTLPNPLRTLSNRGGRFQASQVPGLDEHALFDKRLDQLAQQFPAASAAIRADLKPREEASRLAAAAEGRLIDAKSRTPGASKYIAEFAGGFTASFNDPFQVATMMLGPWRSVGVGARAVVWSAIKQGAANAGVVAAMQPTVQAWRREAGLESGFGQAAANTAMGFVFGATLDAGGRAIARGLRRGRGDVPVLDARGGVTGWKKPEDALQSVVQTLPSDDLVKKAAGGDVEALRTLSAETGADLDPAVQGALRALEIEGDLDGVPMHVDPSDADRRLLQALRAAEDPDEPAPGAAGLVPDQRTPNLADDQPAPAQRFTVEGKPVAIQTIDPLKVTTDADTFQFKGGGDAAGATERLSGVQRWDPIAAGRAVIWERSDGVRIIADGHQRAALARRLADQQPHLQAFVFREADGWTARDVRALAAKKNLQEGSGSVIDAAKIIRERPEIIDKSVPLSSDAMRQARALARLSDEAFSDVVAGMAPPNYASMVADLVPDEARHASVLREVMAADPRNVREARFMISDILQAETVHETQLTLLGAETITRSLLPERAKVLDGAVKILRDDQRIFGLLTRDRQRIEAAGNRLSDTNAERALEAGSVQAAIEQLAATRGKVSDWLSEAARSTTAGVPQKMAAEAFARKVRDALERDGIKGLAAEPETLRAGGFDDPGGPDAQAQIDDLERALAPEIEQALKPETAAERQAVLFSLAPPDLQPKPTVSRDGYGSAEDVAAREYVIDGRRVRGRDQAVKHLISVAAAHAGPRGIARQRMASILIGPPGAGKTTIAKIVASLRQSAIVTADEAKPLLPEYEGGKGSALVHEESQDLATLVQADVMSGGGNLLLEKLGGNPDGIVRLSQALAKAGYTVDVVSVSAPRDVLIERVNKRAAKIGRTVPEAEIDHTLKGITNTLEKLKSEASVKRIVSIDNGGDAPLIKSGKETLGPDAERAFADATRRNAGVVRGSGDERANRGVREGPTGRPDAALYKLSDYFANTGIDALAKRVEASSILKLRPWSQHPGRVLAFHGTEAAFDRFDLSKTADFGLHFGTSDQANKFAEGRAFRPKAAADGQMGRVFPVVLDLNSVVTLPDLGRWSPKAMVDELIKAGVRLPRALADDIRSRTANGADHTREWAYRELRAALTRQGIDGIRYLNTAEGGGLTWSYIVWEPGKVQSATARDQLFALRSDPYVRTPAAERLRPEIQREILKTITMLPPDVKVRVTDRLAGVGGEAAAGMWDGFDRIIYVSLAAGDPVRTARHEVVHALKQSGLLSDQEFDTLYDFAQRFGLREAYGIDKQYADVYRKAYGDRGKDYVESLLREETVANLFSDYSLNGRRFGDVAGGGLVDKIIDAIVEFMARVRNAVNGLGFRDVRDVFEAIETGVVARRAMHDVALPASAASSVHGLHLFAITAYHGTPHTFEPEPGAPAGRFRLDKIGSGEGAQAYGHGLYFAESEGVAKSYKEKLSGPPVDNVKLEIRARNLEAMGDVDGATRLRSMKKEYDPNGRMYQVRINANPEDFLDWDKPLSQQSEKVRGVLKGYPDHMSAQDAYRAHSYGQMPKGFDSDGTALFDGWAALDARNPVETSSSLREAGIPGIKYLDQMSRGQGEGSRNYVVFDPSIVEITHVDGRPVAAFGAEIADAERMGHLQNMAEACRL